MKVLALAALFTCALTVNGLAQKCKEYSATGSTFAFCPPEGWTLSQTPGKDAEFRLPEEKDRAGFMLVKENNTRGDRGTAALAMIRAILGSDQFTEPRLVHIRDRDTASGLHCTVMVFFMDNGGLPLVQVIYLIDGPKNAVFDLIVSTRRDDKPVASAVDAAAMSVHVK